MNTLNEIIGSIDNQLNLEEQILKGTRKINPILGEQEEMCKYVLVRTGSEHLALPINGLSEIGPMPAITPLPNLPSWILGIIGQRGEIVSVIDLNLLMTNKKGAAGTPKRLAVIRSDSMKIGIGIDQVVATVSRPESACISNSESEYFRTEPEVFSTSFTVEGTRYQIIKPLEFMNMDRLMEYYLSD